MRLWSELRPAVDVLEYCKQAVEKIEAYVSDLKCSNAPDIDGGWEGLKAL